MSLPPRELLLTPLPEDRPDRECKDSNVFSDDQLETIREVARDASADHDLRRQLEDRDDQDQSLRPAIVAFGFHFLPADHTEARTRRGGPWGPMIELDGRQFPEPLKDVGRDVLDAWHQMLEEIDEPPVQARCGDLLWVRKYGSRPDQAARRAVGGYLALAGNPRWNDMQRTEGLRRSLEVARELRDHELTNEVASNMLEAAKQEISSDESRPGIPLRLLQPLVRLPSEQQPDGLRDQLDAVGKRYGGDPYIAQAAGESIAQLSTPDERRKIDRKLVRRWIDEATRGDALMRVIRLQQALELALATGLKEEADEVRVLMASATPDDLDLAAVEAEVSLSRGPIDDFSEQLRGIALPQALRIFGAQGPPTGDPTETERAAAETLAETPLSSLIPHVVLGEVYPTPIFKADTPERRQRLELAQYRARLAQAWAVAAASLLDAILEAHDPSKEDLEQALATSVFPADVMERIAAAFTLYRDGHHDECVHLVTPRIEALLRTTAAASGVPVVTLPRGEEPGGVVTLGAILEGFNGRLEEGWRQYLVTVLTDRLGLNLRNAVAHGTRPSFGRTDAALLLHIACLMVGWRIESA
jgi:hypothetical protein